MYFDTLCSGLQTPVVDAGMATPSGTTSVGAGLETPDNLELRKRRIEADMEGGETPQLPYQVIPEKKNDRIGNSMMGSAHTYDLGKRYVDINELFSLVCLSIAT